MLETAIRLRIPDHVVHRPFASETVVLNLKTGRYHGLNPTAGRMFELLGAGNDLGEIAARLATEFSRPAAEIEQDLRELSEQLLERGVLEPDAGPRR